MGRSQETFGKKDREKKRKKKLEEKARKKEMRKENNKKGAGFDSMFGYVDEMGNVVPGKPDPDFKREEVDAEEIVLGIPKKEKDDSPFKIGKVEFFNDQKGFGFIKETLTQEKYFVHVHGLIDTIKENDKVQFELEKGMRGMNCVRVKLIK